MKLKNSLKKRLLVTILFTALYPIILLVLVGYYNYENVVKESFFTTADNTMGLMSRYINADIAEMEVFILDILSDQGFYDVVKQEETLKNSLERYNFSRISESYLRSLVTSKKDFDLGGIYFTTSKDLYYSAPKTGFINVEDIPIEALESALDGSTFKTSYLQSNGREHTIYFARKVLDKDSFAQIGILFFRISPEYLAQIIGEQDSTSENSTYLVSDTGDILATSKGLAYENLIQAFKLHEYKPGRYELHYEDEDYYVLVNQTSALDFTIIDLIPKDVLLRELQKVTDLIIVLSLVNLPIYLFVGNLLYKNIMSPVNALTQGLKKFEKGQLETLIDNQRQDEFGYMIESFNKMTSTLKKLIQEVYEEELARKDAEFAALQEQINPHFLYNTLESINWRAQLAGEQDIALMIQALSKLMDASINRDKRKVCPIREEIAYVDQYVYLIQMRFGEKIQYEKRVDEAVLGYLVPKLFIQPLIENAIKHGLEPKGEGQVYLKIVKVKEEGIEILVSDTGVGMNAEQLMQVQEFKSVGLQNVNRRLFLLYGEKAKMTIESNINLGTKIRIYLPLALEGEADHV